jgi:hypothetical protein
VPENEGRCFAFDKRQGDNDAVGVQVCEKRAEVRLALDGPIAGEDHATRTIEAVVQEGAEVVGERGADRVAFLDRQRHAFGAEPGAFGFSPAGDVLRLFGVDARLVGIADG